MSDFINTAYVIGDDALADQIIQRTVTELSDDTLIFIGERALWKCLQLTELNVPNVKTVKYGACENNSSLVTVNLPSASTIESFAFKRNVALKNFNVPVLVALSNNLLYGCTGIEKVDLPKVTEIQGNALGGCSNLVALSLRCETVCLLAFTNALDNTPIASGTGYIYVPRALLEEYKAATNWSTYAAQFRALEDYTVDGTTTGELDETKIAA